jgi:hypothetical protein
MQRTAEKNCILATFMWQYLMTVRSGMLSRLKTLSYYGFETSKYSPFNIFPNFQEALGIAKRRKEARRKPTRNDTYKIWRKNLKP